MLPTLLCSQHSPRCAGTPRRWPRRCPDDVPVACTCWEARAPTAQGCAQPSLAHPGEMIFRYLTSRARPGGLVSERSATFSSSCRTSSFKCQMRSCSGVTLSCQGARRVHEGGDFSRKWGCPLLPRPAATSRSVQARGRHGASSPCRRARPAASSASPLPPARHAQEGLQKCVPVAGVLFFFPLCRPTCRDTRQGEARAPESSWL